MHKKQQAIRKNNLKMIRQTENLQFRKSRIQNIRPLLQNVNI